MTLDVYVLFDSAKLGFLEWPPGEVGSIQAFFKNFRRRACHNDLLIELFNCSS